MPLDEHAESQGPGRAAGAESTRIAQAARRAVDWTRFGPYLADRQWGTVREDYSADGSSWEYFPHDHARSRAYRWGEDGLLGICDRRCRMALAIALWNGADPILKERLFGLTGNEGNHGEDVKEVYFHLDSTPTHSYLKALYKYPQAAFPYARLVEENRRRGREAPELELADTGVFDEDRYFDVLVEYAKAAPEDILCRITVDNRGPDAASLSVLPTLWFRNTWSWGRTGEESWPEPRIARAAAGSDALRAEHASLGTFRCDVAKASDGTRPRLLFTDNETNVERLFGLTNPKPWRKDAFDRAVVQGRADAVNPAEVGTKAALWFALAIPAGGRVELRLRLARQGEAEDPAPSGFPAGGDLRGAPFDAVFEQRIGEADAFWAQHASAHLSPDERLVHRRASAGLCWQKRFYHYVVQHWLEGDPSSPPPPARRWHGRNADWRHVYDRDVLSMPDGWEYPWFAAWDLAFHAVAFAGFDPEFAKRQLLLLLREWYMHPNGQLPAYEFAFGDANPPVHAWAALRVYQIAAPAGRRDRRFLARVFHKLLLDFTWWVNRKDQDGNHVFAGGFLGLDNVGVFDRSRPLGRGRTLDQADGTAWMAFYCISMLGIALELADGDSAYEDVATKFFEHFIAITDAINRLGGTGLWDEADGFYYDAMHLEDGSVLPLRIRSMVGIIPLFAVLVLPTKDLGTRLPGFTRRARWFLRNRPDLAELITCLAQSEGHDLRLLAIPSRERLRRILARLLDEDEFLSPHGVRSLSKAHAAAPFVLELDGERHEVRYTPGESDQGLFGGNSNWRGPVWLPVNYLLIEALERYHRFWGDSFRIECPTGSGRAMNLGEVALELSRRLCALFLTAGPDGARPWQGFDGRFQGDPHWRDCLWFHEYFNGDSGRGLGASHQTGWTALVTRLLDDLARRRGVAAE